MFPETLMQAIKRIKILFFEIQQAEESGGDSDEIHAHRDEIGNLANDFDIPQATLDLWQCRVRAWKQHPNQFGKVAND